MADRQCVYVNPPAPSARLSHSRSATPSASAPPPPAPAPAPVSASASTPGSAPDLDMGSSENIDPASTPPQHPQQTAASPTISLPILPNLTYFPPALNEYVEADASAPVNLSHMELLIRFSIEDSVPEVTGTEWAQPGTQMLLRYALTTPYLLHEMLALSARHLGVMEQDPVRAAKYLTQAIELQTTAIQIFNAMRPVPEVDTCAGMVLFSSTLGRHHLVDTLAHRDADLGAWLDRYVQYVQLHAGIRVITRGKWDLLMSTDLAPFMEWGQKRLQGSPQGTDLEGASSLIDANESMGVLDAAEVKACRGAIKYLQMGMDRTVPGTPSSGRIDHSMCFNWSLVGVQDAFLDMLRLRKPEALVIMAHYAVLLHHARGLWQIGDAGEYLLGGISEMLGPEWAGQLAWAQAVVGLQAM